MHAHLDLGDLVEQRCYRADLDLDLEYLDLQDLALADLVQHRCMHADLDLGLEDLALEHLIGTKLLRAYMHGFFMDARLYRKAK